MNEQVSQNAAPEEAGSSHATAQPATPEATTGGGEQQAQTESAEEDAMADISASGPLTQKWRLLLTHTLNYAPHPAQQEIHDGRDRRFRCVCTGRRFGKTFCLAAEMLDRGATGEGGDYGWVAPTYTVAEHAVEAFRAMGNGFVQVCGHAPCRVEFPNAHGKMRTRIWFLSADNPDNMRGFGFQGLVIDEAAVTRSAPRSPSRRGTARWTGQ